MWAFYCEVSGVTVVRWRTFDREYFYSYDGRIFRFILFSSQWRRGKNSAVKLLVYFRVKVSNLFFSVSSLITGLFLKCWITIPTRRTRYESFPKYRYSISSFSFNLLLSSFIEPEHLLRLDPNPRPTSFGKKRVWPRCLFQTRFWR